LCNPEPSKRREAINRVKNSIEFAADIEALTYTLHPGLKPKIGLEDKSIRALNQESIVTLLDYADSIGIKATLENMPPGPFYTMVYPIEFEELIEVTGLNLKITFDAAHAHIGGLVREFLARLSDRFLMIHVHDTRGGRDEHLNVGEGSIDWEYIISKLKNDFSGSYIVEAIREPFRSLSILKDKILK
ncbi:MAG: sugar phosphate isomerase/epimerase, partial [Nitrososphaerales archaeon]|nr:sugar phosphate isomerase/epimerase [Nitrososphaerales archaeon]